MELPLVVALRDDGSLDPGHAPGLDGETLLFLYRKMVFLRALDEKVEHHGHSASTRSRITSEAKTKLR